MAWVLFFHADNRETIGAAFGRQIEVDDFGKLFLKQRYEYFVQCNAEHSWLIGRSAGIGRMINRIAPVRHAGYGEDGEIIHFVVVACVIAKRTFGCHLAGFDITLEYKLGTCRNLQIIGTRFHHFGFASA